MIVGYQYTAMKITGAFHLVIGILCFIISMVGFSTQIWYKEYHFNTMQDLDSSIYFRNLPIVTSTPACIISLWVIMVGIFGILAGLESNTELKTRRMKITYMVLAILSACIFSFVGMTAFSFHAVWILYYGPHTLYILSSVGSFAMFTEFVLAIVSSSICCCCSQRTNNFVLIEQNQPIEFVNPATDRSFPPITYFPNAAGPLPAFTRVQ